MPQGTIRRFHNKTTGKTIAFYWDSPNDPTPADITRIAAEQARSSLVGVEHPSISARIGQAIVAPSELIGSPEPMAREDVEALPTSQRLLRKGHELAQGLVSPEVILPVAAATTLGFINPELGAAAKPALSGYFAAQMGRHIPAAVGAYAEHPSLETGIDLGLLTSGTALGGLGVARGMKGLGSNVPTMPPPEVRLLEGKIPSERQLPPSSAPGEIRVGPPSTSYTEPRLNPAIERLALEEGTPPRSLVASPQGETFTRPELDYPGPGRVQGPGFTMSDSPEVKIPVSEETVVKPSVKANDQPSVKINKQYAKPPDWLGDTSTENLKLMRGGARREMADAIDSLLQERGEASIREQRPGEAGFLSLEALFGRKRPPKAYKITEKGSKGKSPTFEEVKADAKVYSTFWNTIIAPIPDAIESIGLRTPAAGELARLFKLERTERNRIRGVYNDTIHKSGVQSFRSEGVDNLSDAEFGNYRVRDTRGGVHTVVPDGVDGANEGQFIQYRNGVREALPGFEIVEPLPGNLIDVLTQNAMPANPRIASAAKGIKEVLDELGGRAERDSLGMRIGEGTTIPFKRMETGYFPQKYSKQFFESLPDDFTAFDSIVKKIAKQEGITEGQARYYLTQSRKYGEILSAPQHARLSNYDAWIRDRSVLFNHIRDLGNRIGTAEILGPKDVNGPLIQNLLKEIGDAGGDTGLITRFMERMLGREEKAPFEFTRPMYQAASKVMTALYLPMFPISNLATSLNIAVRGSTRRLLPALVHNLKVQNRLRSGVRSGALSEYVTDELAPGSFFAKLYRIRGSEQYLRATASEVGKGTARDLLGLLKRKEPTSRTYQVTYGRLKNLLLKSDEEMSSLIRRGRLTNKEIERAGGRMAELTQGLIDPVDMPYGWSNPNALLSDFVLTYKRFAYQSSKILIESIKENPEKAVPMLMALAPVVGETLGDAKAGVKALLASAFTDEPTSEAIIREIERRGDYIEKVSPFFKEHPMAARLVRDYVDSWIFGLVTDIGLAALEDTGGVFDLVPVASLLQDVVVSMKNMVNEFYRDPSFNWSKIEEQLRRFYPGGVGPAITRSEREESSGGSSRPSRPSRSP